MLPFDELPDEILSIIFSLVHADWQSLPSPFQVAHVCQRWRVIANSTPSLWRDTRILRVQDRMATDLTRHFPPIKKPYCFSRDTLFPGCQVSGRKDFNHLKLIQLCARLSHHTLTYFEMEVWEWHTAFEAIKQAMSAGRRSRSTLESIVLRHTNSAQREDQADGARGEGKSFGTTCLELVLACPKLVDVELDLGDLLVGGTHGLSDAALTANPTPSFRRLVLDCFDGFGGPSGTQGLQLLVKRSSQLRTLTLGNVPSVDWNQYGDDNQLFGQPFAIQVIAASAETLLELNVHGEVNVLVGVLRAGTRSLPQLRRFRHIPDQPDDEEPNGMQGLALPLLEVVDAPINIIRDLPCVPGDVTVRLEEKDDDRDTQVQDWLLSLQDEQSPQSLTILAPYERPSLEKILNIFVPSLSEKVVCPKLKHLAIRCTTRADTESTGNLLTFDPLPLPRPVWREEWEKLPDVSLLVRVEEERRRASQGLHPLVGTTLTLGDAAAGPSASASSSSSSSAAAAAATVWPPCEPLSSIEIEGCWISQEAWAEMKVSPCRFSATPCPDEMARLRWEEGENNNNGQKRKRGEESDEESGDEEGGEEEGEESGDEEG